MNYKLKKTLIIGTSILVPTILIGTCASIYFTTPITSRISEKGIYSIRVNENLNNDGYKFDLSATYGSPTANSNLSLLLNNEILHLQTSGKFEYDQINERIIKPSYESLKFGNADSIVLTFIKTNVTLDQFNTSDYLKNNPDKWFQLVFDSDDDEVVPPNFDEKNDYVLSKSSNNPRSINSTIFKEIISNGYLASKPDLSSSYLNKDSIDTQTKNFALLSLGVTFNTNSKWVDSNGNETEYDICPEDMYFSSMRTLLFDKNYRHSNGGSKELDNYFIEKTSTTRRFGETQKYPNEYLLDFFNINKDKLYSKDQAIQDVDYPEYYSPEKEKGKAFTISFNIFDGQIVNQNIIYSVNEIIEKYLSNSLHFSLAPSKFITEKFNNDTNNKTSVGQITGNAAEFGIYTYAQTREETLFASSFIPVVSQSGREIFEYNKYYSNKEWVKSVEEGITDKDGNKYKTINKVIIEYMGGIDTSIFINQSFNSFMNGTLSNVDYSQLSDAQKQKLYGTISNSDDSDDLTLIENSIKNGLQVTKKVNISNLTTRMVWQANPLNGLDTYTFNDNFSKLVFGSSKDEIKNGTAVTSASYYTGYGFKFRLLIQSSINWQTFISEAFLGTRDVWLSGAAQNAKFSSYDINSLSPANFLEQGMNDLEFFDKDDQIKKITYSEMKQVSLMSISDLQSYYNGKYSGNEDYLNYVFSNIARTKIQSPLFYDVQQSMKKLLDDFYLEYNIDSSEKITWEIAYPFADQDINKTNAMRKLVTQVINELDPRIEAEFKIPTTRDEMLYSINQHRGVFNANLWSYDYEGIGSFIAAFTSDGGGTNIIPAIGIFSKDINNDQPSLFSNGDENITNRPTREQISNLQQKFPNFTILSKFVRQHFNEALVKGDQQASELLKVENWDLFNNKIMNNVNGYFNRNDEEKPETWNPNNINPISLLPEIFKKFEQDAPWEKNDNLTSEEKGQKWVDLIRELNSIKGVSIDTESSVDLISKVNFTLYLREYIVPLSKYGLQFFSNITYKINK